jgi:hypothetical protein
MVRMIIVLAALTIGMGLITLIATTDMGDHKISLGPPVFIGTTDPLIAAER